MRNVELHRIANRCTERLQRLGAFQILSAMSFGERNSSDAIVFLLDQFLLENGFGFFFVFEELPIATFADLWPPHTPKCLFLVRATFAFGSDLYFGEFNRSFAHDRECLCNGQNSGSNFCQGSVK
jgi:hypothetical protein